MLTIIRDLLRYDGRFRVAFVFLLFIVIMAVIATVSPFDPKKTFVVPQDRPPSLKYPFGTTSRGQDLFWWMAYAVRNSLVLGIICAVVSRIIAISVGLTAGYRGGYIDRALMSINDSFVVIPVLPILILLSFLMRGSMSLFALGVLLGMFGWPWDGRLIRSQVLSLKERSFTRTAVYSGTNSVRISTARAPSICLAHRVCDHHQQHAVGDRDGGHAERTWALRCLGADDWLGHLLGQSASSPCRRRVVVVGRSDSCCSGALPGTLPALLEHQRVHRSADASKTNGSVSRDLIATERCSCLLQHRNVRYLQIRTRRRWRIDGVV